MELIKSLTEQKGKLYAQLKEASNVPEKDYDDVAVDKINDEISAVDRKIVSANRANETLASKAESFESREQEETFSESLDSFIRTGGSGESVARGEKIFGLTGEKRANQWYKGTDNKGGYLVPNEISKMIVEARAFIGGMITPGLTTEIKTSTGRQIDIPTVDDTSTEASIIGEKTTMATGTDVTYGNDTLDFYKLTTKIVKISNELIQDAAFDVVAHVTGLLFDRMFRGLNNYFTLGTGSSQPYGIQTVSVKGVDAVKRGLTRVNLVDLIYSVDRAYRQGAVFQMDDSTVKVLRKLAVSSDTTGDDLKPLWQASMQAGEPDRLEGYPVIVNVKVDEIASYNQPVFFGDFKRYWIAEALPMKLIRLDELYAATDEVGFNVLGRWAGNMPAYSGDAPIKHIRNANT